MSDRSNGQKREGRESSLYATILVIKWRHGQEAHIRSKNGRNSALSIVIDACVVASKSQKSSLLPIM